ncbi:GIY-YIG nuclease family protein [Methylomonas sp. MO1]|uniref:GIY-YIG nuclease family protein n=1 Tax=Methylomonas sp. MO1 TaxID=3073619 RepID=UPI0028A4ADEC|nr:GIY-YIG nuclease family protein [Methylomonas sp. MO1]MDT4291187.1 GIY-YIG nuclease family protein [Methylomonas sp. MO1]
MSNWSVYIIQCDDGSLYTGISIDVERRFHQHLMQKGAKYFRSRQPRQLVFVEAGHDRVSASRKEALIKQMKRSEKLELIATYSR